MPSPFPGMDPFLEHPGVFPDLHDSFILYLREALQAQLPEPYFAMIRDRLWVELSERFIEPDVHIRKEGVEKRPGSSPPNGGAVGVLTRTHPIVIPVYHDERREDFLEIWVRDAAGERVVTVVEILSPSNKTPGDQGRDLYVSKQREVLRSPLNLVEVDLLRAGTHATGVPEPRLRREAGSFDYHVCMHLPNVWHSFLVYPIRLEEKLPRIEIPLLPGTPAVEVDLQAVFDRTYDAGPYRRKVKYTLAELPPPLSEEKLGWCRDVLKKHGVPAA
ncbi:MAG: DUF4058 family protein, partial [Planctomycetes bacterium]|nr:DUF4058 family protein [Planctomycetota bacterium]